MNMPTTFANFIQRQFQDKQNKLLSDRVVFLDRQVRHLTSQVQAAEDITTNTDSTSNRHYVGLPTRYNSYDKQVAQLGTMYDNLADWGNMVLKNVIDVRTAFSVGRGIDVVKQPEFAGSAETEIAWCKEFMRFNNLNEEMPQEYAKEAEIEGKILFRFGLDEENRNVRLIQIPWRQYKYKITHQPNDYLHYVKADCTATVEGTDVSFSLREPLFVYKRFGGSVNKPNETPPKTAFVIREMEDLDKAIWDWRKINRLFSMPTPVIYCPDKQTAKDVQKWIDESNWRIGKLLILGGLNMTFELVGWKGDGYTTIQKETESLVKTISGTTGIPVHFFGYPELLSNRDTADNLVELIALSTSKERRTWIGAYEEVFQKAIVIFNTAFGTNMNPNAITATIKEYNYKDVTGETGEAISNRNNTSSQQE
uniref:Portal protein n=1 Tax=viral metagenome TaxID=1070528 RepID=A0A6M3KZL3_9ZZZZ